MRAPALVKAPTHTSMVQSTLVAISMASNMAKEPMYLHQATKKKATTPREAPVASLSTPKSQATPIVFVTQEARGSMTD